MVMACACPVDDFIRMVAETHLGPSEYLIFLCPGGEDGNEPHLLIRKVTRFTTPATITYCETCDCETSGEALRVTR